MSSFPDLLQAKQTLSARLLQAGFRGGVVGMYQTLSVKAAVASAGSNVHAVGVGRKVVAGETTTTPCVRIYVVQKMADSVIPPRDALPKEIDGIPTDIVESPPAYAIPRKKPAKAKKVATADAVPHCSQDRRGRQRPVVGGISTAHHDVTAGTLAYFCRSTRHGDDPAQVHVLSNNHVFADLNKAHIGDPLYQPGPVDGGTQSDRYGDLHRFVPIKFGREAPNRVDAAIGALLPSVSYEPDVCMIHKIAGTGKAAENMQVCKHGRTTGYTEGIITDLFYDALVGMDHADPNVVALFGNQMRIERIPPYGEFGLGGDSGSLVVMKGQAKAVGLYFAGPDSGIYGVANHIGPVLAELEIELL